MVIAQSILGLFFANISLFIVEKESTMKNTGHRELWVAIFWSDPPLRGKIGGTPENFLENF